MLSDIRWGAQTRRVGLSSAGRTGIEVWVQRQSSQLRTQRRDGLRVCVLIFLSLFIVLVVSSSVSFPYFVLYWDILANDVTSRVTGAFTDMTWVFLGGGEGGIIPLMMI